ncbi:hypothetical protein BCF89_1205, partial [Metamycoplasma auris]
KKKKKSIIFALHARVLHKPKLFSFIYLVSDLIFYIFLANKAKKIFDN